jgi:hypothetical protein
MPHKPEPRANIVDVCDVHAPRPDPALAARNPQSFLGAWVKKRFRERTGKRRHEHMWVHIHTVRPDGTLVGTLDNDPDYDVGVVWGDTVTVRLDEIEAIAE